MNEQNETAMGNNLTKRMKITNALSMPPLKPNYNQ